MKSQMMTMMILDLIKRARKKRAVTMMMILNFEVDLFASRNTNPKPYFLCVSYPVVNNCLDMFEFLVQDPNGFY